MGDSGRYQLANANGAGLWEQPILAPIHKLRIVCLGAGYAGLMLAYRIKNEMKLDNIIDLVIYEKNPEVGGTWYENRYPGVACDVPAHIYVFPFEPNPDWSSFYVSGPEIHEYIKRTTKKYNLDEKVQLNSKVTETIWDEASAKWKVKIEQSGRIIEDEADICIDASGFLNKWTWPDIEGLHRFKGKLMHTARWDATYGWSNKRVAVIGNGSSAIQVVPKIQPTAKKIVNYIRSPTWISVNYCESLTPEGKNFAYSAEEKSAFRTKPSEFLSTRRLIEHSMNMFFQGLYKDSPEQAALHAASLATMRERMTGNHEMIEKFIPDWEIGCRRLTPGDGYLEALQKPNAAYVFEPIVRITEKGIQTADGREEEFDLIVAATGFDVSFVPHWKLKGRNGSDLSGWKEDPKSYFGICPPGLPNFFVFNGPNSPIGHGNLLYVMWWATEYMLKWCQKVATEDIRSFVVRPEAVRDLDEYTQKFMKRMVWSSGCRSWYKNGKIDGKVTAMYGGSALHFKEAISNLRGEDFIIDYRSKNRYHWLGNGLTARESKNEDLSFYLAEH